MRVFVTQETDRNLSSAKVFGKLIVLLQNSEVYGHRQLPNYTNLSDTIRKQLERNNFCSTDVILPIGDPILIGLSINHAVEITDGLFKVLKWDRERTEYDLIELDIP